MTYYYQNMSDKKTSKIVSSIVMKISVNIWTTTSDTLMIL